jgi:hypothetical protein
LLQLTPFLATLATAGAPAGGAPPAVAVEQQAPPPPRILESNLSAGGGLAGGSSVTGMAFNLMVTHDIGMLELGVEGDMVLLRSFMYGVGALGGIRVGDDVSFRVLATGGVHYYEGLYRDHTAGDPGVSGSVPYIGARWLFGYRFKVSSTKRRPWLGVMGLLDHDLFRETQSVTYSPDGFSETTTRHELGQLTYAVLVMAGWEVDLTPY